MDGVNLNIKPRLVRTYSAPFDFYEANGHLSPKEFQKAFDAQARAFGGFGGITTWWQLIKELWERR